MTTEVWWYALDFYNSAIDDNSDPRTQSWPLVYSPVYPLAIVAVYVYLCWNARTLTENLPACDLRPLLIAYNAFMVALSGYMLFEFLAVGIFSDSSWICEKVDYSTNPLPVRLASANWLYYFSKYIELAETLMFALRKKYNQISFLHVYHHSSMIMLCWISVKYFSGGSVFFFCLTNSVVHFVMYFYYMLSAIGPHMRKYLWWKKYITVIQLLQFGMLLVGTIGIDKVNCGYPIWYSRLMFMYGVSLMILFLNFYVKTYRLADKKRGAFAAKEPDSRKKTK